MRLHRPLLEASFLVRELRDARLQGQRAAVLFVVQRQDVEAFAPHDESDGRLREMLREVVKDSVEAYAYNCQVSPEEVVLDEQVPVMLLGTMQKTGLGCSVRRDGVPAHTMTRAG